MRLPLFIASASLVGLAASAPPVASAPIGDGIIYGAEVAQRNATRCIGQ